MGSGKLSDEVELGAGEMMCNLRSNGCKRGAIGNPRRVSNYIQHLLASMV